MLGARLVAVYGGAPPRHQIDALRRGVDVVVATPGRALDLNARKQLILDQVRTVVLDEADEMLEMGFIEDIETLLAATPRDRQTVLFSATMPKRIDALANRHLRNPERISIKRSVPSPDDVPRVRQTAYIVTRPNKTLALGRILDAEDPTAAIVFCRTRGGVDDLTDVLTARGYQAEALHGGLTQDQRDRVMGRLRTGSTELLIATDVAARGLDVDLLTHVVNFDLPITTEAYVHRIGRVGRAGREGVAISLVEPRERRMLESIERATAGNVRIERIPTVSDVRHLRLQRTRDSIEELLGDADAQERMSHYRALVEDLLLSYEPAEAVLAAFTLAHEATQGSVADSDEGELDAFVEAPRAAGSGKQKRKGEAKFAAAPQGDKHSGGKKHKRPEGPTVRLFVSVGRKAGVTPGDLLGAITGESGLKGADIGTISVHEMFSVVEVPTDKARKIIKSVHGAKIRGRKVTVRNDRDK
jgi:ATP-dependent RNA helicase DeaD